jgi:L-alanine-DL-glutamate epimerase-like enolase superfamily enzyme
VDIDGIRIRHHALPRRDPDWRTASYRSAEVVGVYVEIEAGGALGIGATAAHPRSMPADTLLGELTNTLRPSLVGTPIESANARLRALAPQVSSRARIAVDLALHDLYGKLAGLPAEVLWGGAVRDRIRVIWMVGLKPVDQIVDAVAPLYDAGVRGFKIKIGESVDTDAERIRRVRAAYGDVVLTADANGAYDLAEATKLCEHLAELDVHLVEQPIRYDDVDAMVALRSVSRVKLMADQMVASAADAVRIAQLGAADVVSLKLTKMGSVAECVRVVDVCAAVGLGAHLGGTAAPGIIDSALVRLALTKPEIEPMSEVAESQALVEDGEAGVSYSGEWATSDGRSGLGGSPPG